MKQRLTEWLMPTQKGEIGYYTKQFKKPYRSTVHFCKWLEKFGLLNSKRKALIADIGAGLGGNIFYMAKRYPNSKFIGIDINSFLVRMGNKLFKKFGQKNCKMVKGDIYKLDAKHIGKYDGIISYQTLSWLPDYKIPIKKITELNPQWIAITSLFFDDNINCKIIVQDYTLPLGKKPYRECYYNTYSIRLVRELFEKLGYKNFNYTPFQIDVDLPKPKQTGMGTYTEKLKNGQRIQISGPLLMNWYFVLARKL